MNFDTLPLNEDETPEYRLGFSENKHSKNFEELNPAKMRFGFFESEYLNTMNKVREKEKKGKLDPHDKSYVPMRHEEWELMAKDWKEFSRSRGFSEKDIEEYEKWIALSGQKDKLNFAINDPWRRNIPIDNFIKALYIEHIENAIKEGGIVSEDVMSDYYEIKKEEESDNIIKPEEKKNAEDSLDTDSDWS